MYRRLGALLGIGGATENPLQVLVRHDDAGLQEVLGWGNGDAWAGCQHGVGGQRHGVHRGWDCLCR